jgi:hypothetical protein
MGQSGTFQKSVAKVTFFPERTNLLKDFLFGNQQGIILFAFLSQ